MEDFNETKAVVEQFLQIRLGEDSTTNIMTSELIKRKDQYLSRVPNNLTAFQCAKKLAYLPDDFSTSEPIFLNSTRNQTYSKVSLYIRRKQFKHFLRSVDDPKDWNLIVKILNDLAEVAIDYMAVYGIDVIDDFVLTATDLIMNCPAQDGTSIYSLINSAGDWENFVANLTRTGCCSINKKPWAVLSPEFAACLVCETYWCRLDKSCHEKFFTYDRFKLHRKRFIHKTPTDFAKECGKCGAVKGLTRPIYNRCNNCSSHFCTIGNCSKTFSGLEWQTAARTHYSTKHDLPTRQTFVHLPAVLKEPRNCCRADKKPPTKVANDCAECEVCGKLWCRIDKSCDKSYLSGSTFRTHRRKKHENPTDFKIECSNCGRKKVRTKTPYRKCQCIKYHCNVEGCTQEYVVVATLHQAFRKHYTDCHPGLQV